MLRRLLFLFYWIPAALCAQMPTQEYDQLRLQLQQLEPGRQKLKVLHRLAKGIRDEKTQEALVWVEQEVALAKTMENDTALAKGLISKGWILSHLGEVQNGLALYQEGYAIADRLQLDCISANASNMLAGAYQGLGDLPSSIDYYLRALDYYDRCNVPTGVGTIHNNLASMYLADGSENLSFVFNHLQKALLIFDDLKDSMRLCAIHLNFAEAYSKQERPEKVEEHLQLGLAFSQARNALIFKGSALTSLGSFYLSTGRKAEGIDAMEQAIATNLDIGDRQKCIGPHVELARHYLAEGNYGKSETHANRALAWSQEFALPQYVQEAFLVLSELAAIQGDSATALRHYQGYSAARDSALSKERIQSVKQLQFKYETALREQELVTVKTDAERKQLVLLFTLIGLGLAVVTGVSLLYANVKRKKANALLQVQRDQLDQRNQEKEALLKEIHHRVKNNLQVISSLLDLQRNTITDPAALQAIQEGQSRVKSIAMIHQKLYQTEDLAQVGFQEYATQLANFLASTFRYDQRTISTVVQANGIQLDIDTAVPLGLILNELVTNAYKYAFQARKEGAINITLRKVETDFELTVSDNGAGLPDGFDVSKATSLGIKLVHILTRQLGGTVNTKNLDGAHFTIRFKGAERS